MKKLLLPLIFFASLAYADSKTDTTIVPKKTGGSVLIQTNKTTRMSINNAGTTTVSGPMTLSSTISGNGSGLTTLNGSNISSGTVSASYLPAAEASASGIVNQSTQTFAGDKTFANKVQISGSIPASLGAATLFRGSTYGGSIGSISWGVGAVDTLISLNFGNAGGTILLLCSANAGAGTSTSSAVYILKMNYDGSNPPTKIYLGGSSDFITLGTSGSYTITLTGSSGNNTCTWFVNK